MGGNCGGENRAGLANTCNPLDPPMIWVMSWHKKKEDDNQVAQFLSKHSSHVYLFEHKRLFLVDWIDTIIWYNFCLVLSSDSVGRQAKHIYFNIGTDLLFW